MHMLYKYFMIDMMHVILLLLLYSSSFDIRFDIFLNIYWRYRFPTSGNVVAMDIDNIINPSTRNYQLQNMIFSLFSHGCNFYNNQPILIKLHSIEIYISVFYLYNT